MQCTTAAFEAWTSDANYSYSQTPQLFADLINVYACDNRDNYDKNVCFSCLCNICQYIFMSCIFMSCSFTSSIFSAPVAAAAAVVAVVVVVVVVVVSRLCVCMIQMRRSVIVVRLRSVLHASLQHVIVSGFHRPGWHAYNITLDTLGLIYSHLSLSCLCKS